MKKDESIWGSFLDLEEVGDDIPDGELEKSKAEGSWLTADAGRHEATKKAVHAHIIWFLRIGFFCFAAVFLVRAYHLIAAEQCSWLTDDKIQSIDKILFSGIAGGAMGRYFGRIFPGKNGSD